MSITLKQGASKVKINGTYVDLPFMQGVSLPGYNPVSKTATMTSPVGKDLNGQLWAQADTTLSTESNNAVANSTVASALDALPEEYLSIEANQGTTAAQKNNALKNIGITDGTTGQRSNLAVLASFTLLQVGTVE